MATQRARAAAAIVEQSNALTGLLKSITEALKAINTRLDAQDERIAALEMAAKRTKREVTALDNASQGKSRLAPRSPGLNRKKAN